MALRTILANDIIQAVREACIEGCCVLPAPVVQALERAKEQEQGHARAVLEQLLQTPGWPGRPCGPAARIRAWR